MLSEGQKDLLDAMDTVRKLVSMFERLRKDLKIPLRQPLLDYAFGWTTLEAQESGKYKYLLPGERTLVAEAINILDQGYDFASIDYYEGLAIEPPTGEHWVTHTDDGLFVSLYTKQPDWLKEIGEERLKRRKEIMRRKKQENE